MKTLTSKMMILLQVAILTFATTVSPMASANTLGPQPWTANGSAGTVDETSYNLTKYINGAVYLSDYAPGQAEAVIRYNVTATTGLTDPGVAWFTARVLDNGPQAQVVLYLRSYELATGIVRNLATIDSNSVQPSSNFQMITFGGCPSIITYQGGWRWDLDFNKYSYYVEAHLIRTGYGGNPGLGILKLETKNVICF